MKIPDKMKDNLFNIQPTVYDMISKMFFVLLQRVCDSKWKHHTSNP